MRTKLTLLNSMAGKELNQALEQHVAWGLTVLDLKDAIFGKRISELTQNEAEQAANLIETHNLSVHCLSTGLFFDEIERGETEFRRSHLDKLDAIIDTANVLRPNFVRLLAARTANRSEIANSIPYINRHHSWLIPLYIEAIDRLHDAGFKVTIENEVHGCMLSTPTEILDFFASINRPNKVCLTWDVQNLWQMGTYPTTAVYDQLKDLIGYYHLKGGQQKTGNTTLHWRSSLADASWPVVEITRQVVADGVSPVICLNPSHGKIKPGYDYENIVQRDLDFVRREILE